MQIKMFALLLPLCLAACSDNPPAEAEKTTANKAVAQTKLQPLPENHPQLAVPKKTLSAADSKPVSEKSIQAAKDELTALITDPQCDAIEQCKVLAVGSRACGGPSSYVVYSTKTAEQQQVEKLAKQITQLESNYNTQNQMVSICQHLTAPSTQCVENKCVKLEGSAVSVF
ncbi:hypothetical protein [Pseudoalteromonas sp.]|uniref:hypothetical protein n=1 Tax=Pseudoalteromonas sp. TaxID=53249 RepID=UPI003567D79F